MGFVEVALEGGVMSEGRNGSIVAVAVVVSVEGRGIMECRGLEVFVCRGMSDTMKMMGVHVKGQSKVV